MIVKINEDRLNKKIEEVLAKSAAHDAEIEAVERIGAERLLHLIKHIKPFVDNGDGPTICDHCMMKVWKAFEKEQRDED